MSHLIERSEVEKPIKNKGTGIKHFKKDRNNQSKVTCHNTSEVERRSEFQENIASRRPTAGVDTLFHMGLFF